MSNFCTKKKPRLTLVPLGSCSFFRLPFVQIMPILPILSAMCQGGHMKQYRCGMGLSLLYAGLNWKIHLCRLALPLHWAPRNGLNARECFIVEVSLSQTIHCKVVSVCCHLPGRSHDRYKGITAGAAVGVGPHAGLSDRQQMILPCNGPARGLYLA